MLEIIIIAIGKVKNEFFAGAIKEYLIRLKPYASVKVLELAAEPFNDSSREKAKKAEGERVVAALEKYPDADIWLLREQGKEFDSPAFAKQIEGAGRKIVFVIAGALGFSEDISQKKYKQLSLSKLTFPHELARLVLLEQIYRAATIIKRKTYHY